jgi:hypothetical protein
MTSVILPTRNWTLTVEDTADVIDDPSELIIVCDGADDPVINAAPNWKTVGPAGEPDGCSEGAHALATGIEVATDDIIVWTCDDVNRDTTWLDRLPTHARTHAVAQTAQKPISTPRQNTTFRFSIS